MAKRSPEPRFGPAAALWRADAETPVDELPDLLASVARWECESCGSQRFGYPEACSECGGESFNRVIPDEENSTDD